MLPLQPGWAEHCIGGCEQEKVTSAVRWDDKRHLFQQRSLPSLDLDLPQVGPGLYSLHGCQVWERKDWELRLAPRGRCGSKGFPIAKWGLELGHWSRREGRKLPTRARILPEGLAPLKLLSNRRAGGLWRGWT